MAFLKNLTDKLKSIGKIRDPSEFNDEIALRTEWEAFRKVSGNFDTHKLVEASGYDGLRYKPAAGFFFLTGTFMLVGSGTAVGVIASALQRGEELMQEDVLGPALIGLFFLVAGLGLFALMRRPIFFDRTQRCMILKDERTYFSDMHAIQLLVQRGQHTNYQLNLVMRDAGRVYVMNYVSPHTARKDAARIADIIGLSPSRIWDALPGYPVST